MESADEERLPTGKAMQEVNGASITLLSALSATETFIDKQHKAVGPSAEIKATRVC